MTQQTTTHSELDYEKISIYPHDYDTKIRHKLYEILNKLGITIDYEQY